MRMINHNFVAALHQFEEALGVHKYMHMNIKKWAEQLRNEWNSSANFLGNGWSEVKRLVDQRSDKLVDKWFESGQVSYVWIDETALYPNNTFLSFTPDKVSVDQDFVHIFCDYFKLLFGHVSLHLQIRDVNLIELRNGFSEHLEVVWLCNSKWYIMLTRQMKIFYIRFCISELWNLLWLWANCGISFGFAPQILKVMCFFIFGQYLFLWEFVLSW